LVVGLFLLIKGADWLVSGSSSIARSLHISEFVIGLTVVSFGTSLPELMFGLAAGAEDAPELIIGNVVGSNIANIFLVLGVAATIFPLPTSLNTVRWEIPFTLLASFVLIALLNDPSFNSGPEAVLSRGDGVVLLGFFCIFVVYVYRMIRSDKSKEQLWDHESHSPVRSVVEIVAGAAGLAIGGRMAVASAQDVALAWGMSEAFVGFTLVALGTSLPELVTSAVAARRKNADIAVGNVVGSNIFNLFIVLGITSVYRPIAFEPEYNIDLLVMVLAVVLLFVFMFIGKPRRTIQRAQGGVFVALYVGYIVYVTMRG
jgi:cation:H+ antiporter